jgi:hypothetical protein
MVSEIRAVNRPTSTMRSSAQGEDELPLLSCLLRFVGGPSTSPFMASSWGGRALNCKSSQLFRSVTSITGIKDKLSALLSKGEHFQAQRAYLPADGAASFTEISNGMSVGPSSIQQAIEKRDCSRNEIFFLSPSEVAAEVSINC